jgi:hypothetical protein
MAVEHKYERGTDKKESIGAFQIYLDYLEDPTHEDHEGITLLPGLNYNCGPSRSDLVAAVERMHENYIEIKDATNVNKRTHNLWDEVIVNPGEGCYITAEERGVIEREAISKICPDSPARATWHINEQTGKCDLHIVFAVKRPNGKLTLERTNIGQSIKWDAIDQFVADLLNNSKKKPKKRKHHIETVFESANKKSAEIAHQNNKPKPLPLHVQVAQIAEEDGLDEVEDHHLRALLERLRIRIKEIVGGVIYYYSSRTSLVSKNKNNPDAGDIRKSRIKQLPVDPFLFKVLDAQMDIRIERDRVKALEKPRPDPPMKSQAESPTISPPESPAKSVKTKTKPKAMDVAQKAALLQRYYEAALGRTKVKSNTLTKLANATKGMRSQSGKINDGILKQLTPEQKAILVPMADALANEI